MQTDKQKWVGDVLSSADGIKKVSPIGLADKVVARITRPTISKSEWVDGIMNSTDGMSRVVPDDMTDAVLSRIGSVGKYAIAPSHDNSLMWRIAASVALLLLLNGVALYRYQSNMSGAEKGHEMQAVASELGIGQGGSDPGASIFGN